MKLDQVIDHSPLKINPDSYLVDAIILMNQEESNHFQLANCQESLLFNTEFHKVNSCVLVVEETHLLGILTSKDILKITALGLDLSKTKIAEVMTPKPITLTLVDSQDIFRALSLLQQHQIHHLPIVDTQGQILGIVSETSLLRTLDLVKLMGTAEALKECLQQPKNEINQINQQIEPVREEIKNYLQQWMNEQGFQEMQVNQELHLTLEELQTTEEELRQQIEKLAFANETIELERQRYQDLFEFAPDGYLVTNISGIIQEVNLAAASLLAIEQIYLIGKQLAVFIAEQDRDSFRCRLKNLHQLEEWELCLQPRKNPAFPARVRVAPVYDTQGQTKGWRWLIFNISKRKQTEAALIQASEELEKRVLIRTKELVTANELLQAEIREREQVEQSFRNSEGRFRKFAENTYSLIWICPLDNPDIEFYINPAYETIWGRSSQELKENINSWGEAVHIEDRDRILGKLNESHRNHQPTDQEYRIVRPDGSIRWVWSRTFPIYNEEQEVYCYGGIAEDISERKQAEELLRESEARLTLALESAQMGIWDWDLLNNNTLWSPNMSPLYGLPMGTLSPKIDDLVNLIHPEDRENFIKTVNSTIETRSEFTCEYRVIWTDGNIHWLNSKGKAYYDKTGQAVRMIGTTRDISERKQGEAALQESEERYRSVVSAMAEGILVFQADGTIITCNFTAEEILGLTSEQMIGHNYYHENWQIVDENGHVFLQDDFPAIFTLRTGQSCSNVVMGIYNPNGQLVWISVNSQPLFYENQPSPYAVVISFSDISDRKQAQEKIYEQAALLDIVTDAIFVRDFENRILFWNQAAEKIYGWQNQEVIGKNIRELIQSPISLQQEAEALSAVIKYGTWQGELNRLTKCGKELIVESNCTLMFHPNGEPKSILTVDSDITETKQLQQQLLRSQRIESIGTLAGGIAHDLNNILTPILGSAQVLKGRYNQSQELHQEMLTMIESNAKRGAALVKQVLSFARGLKGERSIIQVKHLIMEVMEFAKQTFPKSIEFTTEIADDLWAISGDVTQIHQVLMNLVVNARDAMPTGGNLIISAKNIFIDQAYIRMNLDAKVGNYILITITDTGIGMSPKILERIFEPFFTTKEVGSGTGLGLSMVDGILKEHHGFVKVSSKVGQGSKFEIFLPSIEATQTIEIDNLEMLQGQGELILVVDDEIQICNVTKIILEGHNYRTIFANNGIEAIAMYAQHKHNISAVIMDMIMPEMDGVIAIRTLQKINPQVKIIACSGLNLTDLLTSKGDIKVQGVLSKPYTAKELLQNLNDILEH
ncbi:PAS domain S-box protein [Cronbergia sp. UHCC 0137]|uniref:PAS domain S-box protein n=1 Tax=Cronbergia sp. UHCC 0137 TaxID=3110239 RepID=UPI002B207062|nr:PAS domain S-box protein [Cronbergia sp. UHCC 0137]MEA5618197.1 PAS domain S-box protein [Cronbergia sp. UHCC 0137]